MRRPNLALVFALVAAACAGTGSPATTPATLAATPATTTRPAVTSTTLADRLQPELATVECGTAPPADFAILCQAYELVVDNYVLAVDPPALAAAALAGVTDATSMDADTPGHKLVCALPAAAFDSVCAAITTRAIQRGVKVEDLVEGAVAGMFRFGLDPFSIYIPPESSAIVDQDVPGRVASLGIVVTTRTPEATPCRVIGDACRLEVVGVVEFGPAWTAGVSVGDVIEAVGGVDLAGRDLVEAVERLHGPVGSSVVLGIRRADTTFTKNLVRAYVPAAYVEWDHIAADTTWIHLADFSRTAAATLGDLLASPELAATDRIVLDLRGNPGGLLAAAQAVISQFETDDTAFLLTDANDTVEVPVLPGGLATDLRLVVLVDRGTASAAEVVAAALQESGRAEVVGERTFGKDLVQEVFRLRNGGEVHISTAHWTTVGGASVRVGGVVPDVEVAADVDGTGDPAMEAALTRLGR